MTGAGSFSPGIVDALIDAILIVDDQGRVIYANPAVGQLLGWDIDSLFGVPFVTLVPEGLRSEYFSYFETMVNADPPLPSQAPRRIIALGADGSELPVDLGSFLVTPSEGSRLMIFVLWDVTGRVDITGYQRVADDLLAFLAGASGDPDELVPQLLSIIADSMDFEFATAWRWDSELERMYCEHLWRRDQTDFANMVGASTGMTVRSGEGLPGLVVNSDRLIWQSDLARSTQLNRHNAIVADGLQTAFAFPIRIRNRLIGVIELFTRARRQPDPPLTQAVAEICARLGEFIERVELETQRSGLILQLEQAQREQSFLLKANLALAGARDFRDSVERLAAVALPTLGDICLIDVVDSEGRLQRLAARHADPARQSFMVELMGHSPDIEGSHPAARAVRTLQSQWSGDMGEGFMRETTQSLEHLEATRALKFESYVSVPMLIEGEAIGALTVVTAGGGPRFNNDDLTLAETLASQVASVFDRARRFDEQANISHQLQASLLPTQLGQVAGIDVAPRYVAGSQAAEVGGDFYDVIMLSHCRLALVIGDVEGHDMTAATVMGAIRNALRAYLLVTEDTAGVMTLLDDFLSSQPTRRLATACLAILDTEQRTIEVASAGHPLPILAGSGQVDGPLAVQPGPPVGLGQGRYEGATFAMPATGTMALYTDGLIDFGRPDAESRLDRMQVLMRDHQGSDVESLADLVLSGVASQQFLRDDIALLVVHWLIPLQNDERDYGEASPRLPGLPSD